MAEKDLMTDVRELVKEVTVKGYKKTMEACPLFTQLLIMWAKENNYTEALTEFLSHFVANAVNETMRYFLKIAGETANVEGDDTDDAK